MRIFLMKYMLLQPNIKNGCIVIVIFPERSISHSTGSGTCPNTKS